MSTKKQRLYAQIALHSEGLIRFFKLPAQDPVALSKKLFMLENEAHRLTTDWANGKISESEFDGKVVKIRTRLEKVLGKGNMNKVLLNQDPRGFALKIDDKYGDDIHRFGIMRDMGGYGIIAPDFRE